MKLTLPGSVIAKKSCRILCVDDNALLGSVLVKVFEAVGHTAEHVSSGVVALQKLAAEAMDFDVVVTDHAMPGMDGLALVQLVQKAGFCGRIIVYTSGVTQEQRERYRACKVTAIVLKDSRGDELLNAIETSAPSTVTPSSRA